MVVRRGSSRSYAAMSGDGEYHHHKLSVVEDYV